MLGNRQATNASALGLKLIGSVHRLVLEGEAPALALLYPSVCRWSADPDAAWAAYTALIEERFDAVDAGIERPVQTNAVGRAGAPLWPGGEDATLVWSGLHSQTVRWLGSSR